MSDHITPSNADNVPINTHAACRMPFVQQTRPAYARPGACTGPAYGQQPTMPQDAMQTVGAPPQARHRQTRSESRFSYGRGIPPRRNGKWMPDHQCGPGNAVKRFFEGCMEFRGRSSRREFWLAMLFVVPVTVLPFLFPPFGTLMGLLWSLSIAVPFLAVSIRRLHDANLGGWWLLLGHSGNIIAAAILAFTAVGMVFVGIGAIMMIPNEMELDLHDPDTFAGQLLVLLYASFGFSGVSLVIQTCLFSLPGNPEGARFD